MREEATELLAIAWDTEPAFYTVLLLLLSTGCRRGEAVGLQWQDVDFDRSTLRVRRSISKGYVSTPKSGHGRLVSMPPSLAEALFDLLAARRLQVVAKGWKEVPEWVFAAETGARPDPSHVSRVWRRVRRRAQAKGVRPFPLHSCRHTWATLALESGRSIRWVADQLGHADPAMTLRVYVHAMPAEEADLSFADFGTTRNGPIRPLDDGAEVGQGGNPAESLARPAGLEPAAPSSATAHEDTAAAGFPASSAG